MVRPSTGQSPHQSGIVAHYSIVRQDVRGESHLVEKRPESSNTFRKEKSLRGDPK